MTCIVTPAPATHMCTDCPTPTPARVTETHPDGSVEHLCVDCSAWRVKSRQAAEVVARVAKSLGFHEAPGWGRWRNRYRNVKAVA